MAGKLGGPAAVLGSSLGGLIAAYVALEHPASVSALVLDEPALWDPVHMPGVRAYIERCYKLTSLGKTVGELCEILQLKDVWSRRWQTTSGHPCRWRVSRLRDWG
jgi:pimeloyl-ACP methyl ester carboxylesterase